MKDKKTETRFVGIDLGKRTYEMEILRKGTAEAVCGKVTRNKGRTSVEGRQKLYKKLHLTDKVALEAGIIMVVNIKKID